MKFLMLSLASLSLSGAASAQTVQERLDAVHNIPADRAALASCLRDRVLALGRTNQETADTLLRAARSECADKPEALQKDYEAGYVPEYKMQQMLREDETAAEDAAIAALLEARAH